MATKNNTARKTFANTIAVQPVTIAGVTMTKEQFEMLTTLVKNMSGSPAPAVEPAKKPRGRKPIAPVLTLPVPATTTAAPAVKSEAPAKKSEGPSRSGTYLAKFAEADRPAVRTHMKNAHNAGKAAGKGKAYTTAYNAHMASVGLPAYY